MLQVTATAHIRTILLVERASKHFMHDLTMEMQAWTIITLTILTNKNLVTKEFV